MVFLMIKQECQNTAMTRVNSISNYPPFGMVMPGRSFTSESYRFGFNGMEKSDDLIGGNYTTPFRELDPRLGGRWWSPDPIVKPWESSYAGFGNNPILYADPSGLDPTVDGKEIDPNGGKEGAKAPNGGTYGGEGGIIGGKSSDITEIIVTAKKPVAVPAQEISDNTQTGLDKNVQLSQISYQNDHNNALQRYQESMYNKLLTDYEFRASVISQVSEVDPQVGIDLFNELHMARTNQIGAEYTKAFVVGMTVMTPIPGDEYIAAGITAVSRTAMRTTIVLIERYIPATTMRLLTDPIQKTLWQSPGLAVGGDRFVTGVLFANKYRFQLQKGSMYGSSIRYPHLNTPFGSGHIFLSREGIAKFGLFGQ